MKKVVILALFLLCSIAGICQVDLPGGASANGIHALKTNTQASPSWTLDADYRYGWIDQTLVTIDLRKAYHNSLTTSVYNNPKFTRGHTVGGELTLSHFFNKKHTLGLGVGAMFMRHSGRLTMAPFKADYQETDKAGRIYRQIVRSNGSIGEDIQVNDLNIPIMLKFKTQDRGSSMFGIWLDAGPVVGIYNTTRTTRVDGTFSYEAVYRLSGESMSLVSGFDGSPNPDPATSLILTEDYLARTGGGTDARAFFDKARSLPHQYNVGLYKNPASHSNRPSNEFNSISLGGIIQAGMSYAMSHRVTVNLGYYFMYQSYSNAGTGNNHITDRVVEDGTGFAGNYLGLSNVASKAGYTSTGIRAGLRIFLGGTGRDIDGDGYIDSRDDCPREWGTVQGCPDSDGDGLRNAEDVCPDEYGSVITRGCKDDDGDGIANREDSCRDEPGQIQGCPIAHFADAAPPAALLDAMPDSAIRGPAGVVMAPPIIQKTYLLYFGSSQSEIDAAAAVVLDKVVEIARDSRITIQITGYTDARSSFCSNLLVAYQRATAAKDYLREYGIPEYRIVITGLCKMNSIVRKRTQKSRLKKRGIELRLVLPVEAP